MAIRIENLSKDYDGLILYQDFNMEIPEGKITAITGASGGGKTTFMRMLAGLEPYTGKISGLPPREGDRRGIACLFQDDCLLPWMTLEENIDLVMRSFLEKEERQRRIQEVVQFLQLQEFGGYYPDQLSGGMQRRTALGRMMAYDGELLLMDEPFKGLDDVLRFSLREQLKQRWITESKTVVFITHDLEEANYLADTVFAFSGRPVQAAVLQAGYR